MKIEIKDSESGASGETDDNEPSDDNELDDVITFTLRCVQSMESLQEFGKCVLVCKVFLLGSFRK